MTCRAAINTASPAAPSLPERLAHEHLWRGIASSESNVNVHWLAEQERRLAAASRAALDEAAAVAREDKGGTKDCRACGCWNTSERIAAAIESLKGA